MRPLNPAQTHRLRCAFIAALLSLLFLTIPTVRAGSATWSSSPTDQNLWGDPVNWVPQTVPNGASDVATFATSSVTSPLIDADDGEITVSGIVFGPGASPFSIGVDSANLVFQGAGVTNNSGITQNLLVSGTTVGGNLDYDGTSTSGSAMTYTLLGGSQATHGNIGFVYFNDTSNAGSANFNLQGATSRRASGAQGYVYDSATLNTAVFNINGATASGGRGAQLSLNDSSTAAHSTLIASGGTNGGAGGTIFLNDDCSANTAQVQALGNGQLDVSGHNLPGVTTGSVTGNGRVFLGANSLTINNTSSTVFSGVIQDGGLSGGTGGSLVKEGHGTLTLNGANTYTGGTTVNRGSLLVTNTTGSATGTGAVTVSGATLAGTGIISGAVSVTSSAKRGFLAPGNGLKLGTLTILGPVTLGPPGGAEMDFQVTLKPTSQPDCSHLNANGVTISTSVFLSPSQTVDGAPPLGTVFTLINNTSATPVSGNFALLPEGGTISLNSHMYTVSYVGGDGNDVTMTYIGG